jgi:myo-inositol-1(or 4)-monophosphatase
MTDYETLLSQTEIVVRQATARLMALRGSALAVQRKQLRDVVTEADLQSEDIIVTGLQRLTPGAAILAEERGSSAGERDGRWIIDPLDGTVNYASGLPWFSATVAYQEGGETQLGFIHAPAMDLTARFVRGGLATINDRPVAVSGTRSLADATVSVILTSHFTAAEVRRAAEIVARLGERVRGVRILVSGAIEMMLVAAGQLDGFVSLKADAVSHAGAMPLVRAAGGVVTTTSGRRSTDDNREKIASNGHIHEELLVSLAGRK